ncbi:GspH/FimT family pseudopilin [Ramlibacter sp. AN1015]|uniref:GspH/FimT family pseudopilin n=1 Tax=Ramlibacter sp. AN1015 TaxID=3133428 RepID=UPI0030C607E4
MLGSLKVAMRTSHAPVASASRSAGFTLIELMVVLAVVAVLATLAAPSLRGYTAQQRVKNASYDLAAALTNARSEAVKRNEAVVLRPVTGSNWNTGWEVVVVTPGTSLITNQSSAELTVTCTAAGTGCAGVTYDGSGRITGDAPRLQFTSTGASVPRCVSIDLNGRPGTKKGAC